MRPKAIRGACAHCGKVYTRAGMAKHLARCLADRQQKIQGQSSPCFHLQVKAKYSSAYWLHLQASADATLKNLDSFLRKTWLECCGHMSMFRVEHREIGMNRKLGSLLQPGMEIDYEYDMGSTTALHIVVLGQYPGWVAPKRPVEILARNHPPVIICAECGQQPSVWICLECSYDGEGWLCASCAAEHSCGDEDYFLPVVNSPRAGVCGYTGE